MQTKTVVDSAIELACESHKGQRRKYTGKPYIEHPQRVAARVAAYPGTTLIMVAAAWLHDVWEDTPTTLEDIEAACGSEVATLVKELTNPSKGSSLPRTERKRMDREHLAGVSREAKIIKMFDRMDNLGDLASAPRVFRAVYAMESRMLMEAIGDADTALREEVLAAARPFTYGGGPAPA